MSSSPKSTEQTAPASTLSILHQQHRNRKVQATPQTRGRNTARNEGKRNKAGAKVTRIYPTELAKSKTPSNRVPSTSPSTAPSYNATISPLLSALGATRSAASQYTTEWTKSLSPYPSQASPGTGGIAIASSPPMFHNSLSVREGVYAQQTTSHSPPGMRPPSYPNQYATFGGRLQSPPQNSPGRDRRASTYSRQDSRRPSQTFAPNPPLPHQLQPHFYGLPELDLGLENPPNDGIQPGERGHYCGFDTLSMAGDEAGRIAENILLVGSQGGIDAFRVERSKMDLVGRLEGLRGSVLGAKVLSWAARSDPLSALRPLVALTLHGPVIKKSRSCSGSGSSSVIDDSASDSPSRPTFNQGDDSTDQVMGYQTTVEIYSLRESKKIAVLYKSPLVPLIHPVDSPLFQPPPAAGDFVVDAKGQFIVVASGASGEVFIFAPYHETLKEHPARFRCVGKVWTSVQLREKVQYSSASSGADGSHEDVPPEKFGVPLFSLSDRWLAVTPPASSSLYPVNGTALVSSSYERPPGVAHHSVPAQPSPNCTVEAPETAGLIDRITREGTQVAIKGARWATERGIQAFKSYMNKGAQMSNIPYNQDAMQQYFPPTHGHHQTQPRQESSVISIYDLPKMLDAEETKSKNALHPVVTVPANLGCSFLSFSPSGLMLMTVSKKGDHQDVWDLKRMNFRKSRKTVREQANGPHVRQVARFTRMTVASVIDVVWSAPRVDKVAVVTDKGTVHMFLMPASAFQWPPPRRIRPAANATKVKGHTPQTTNGGVVSSALQSINDTTKPFIDAVRTQSTTAGPRFSLASFGITPAAGAKSGKAVAAGVGKSINNMRHAGDNKITLPSSSIGVYPNSVRWLTGRGRGSIAIVSGGILQIWRVQMRASVAKGTSSNSASISKKKISEFALAPIQDNLLPPSVVEELYPQQDDSVPTHDVHGDWIPLTLAPQKPDIRGRKPKELSPAPLSFSEIETNPPYQPFYTDRRGSRFVYARNVPEVQGSGTSSVQMSIPALINDLHHEDDCSAWLFGEAVDARRIASPVTQEYVSGEDDLDSGVAAEIENRLVLRDGEEEVEQVVVTTRRRRVRREGSELDQEGFFEDDCEVLDFAEDRV